MPLNEQILNFDDLSDLLICQQVNIFTPWSFPVTRIRKFLS